MGLWKKQAMSDADESKSEDLLSITDDGKHLIIHGETDDGREEELTQQDEGRHVGMIVGQGQAIDEADAIPMLTAPLEGAVAAILKTHTHMEIVELGLLFKRLYLMCMDRADQISDEARFAKLEEG